MPNDPAGHNHRKARAPNRSQTSILTAGISKAELDAEESRLWAARVEYKRQRNYKLADLWAQLVLANRPSWRAVLGGQRQPIAHNFTELLRALEIVDDRYPVKGCHVLRPYGLRYVRSATDQMSAILEDAGYEPHLFPTLIDPAEAASIDRSVMPLGGRVFKVSSGALEFVLKSTGEPSIYPMFRTWIGEGSPLPLRVYQLGPYFRPRGAHHAIRHGARIRNRSGAGTPLAGAAVLGAR